mgnify:CR=1 FL=1
MRPSPSANAAAVRRTSACFLESYRISDADLAAYAANPPRRRYRNTKSPSTPALEERWLLEGRTWPDWAARKAI